MASGRHPNHLSGVVFFWRFSPRGLPRRFRLFFSTVIGLELGIPPSGAVCGMVLGWCPDTYPHRRTVRPPIQTNQGKRRTRRGRPNRQRWTQPHTDQGRNEAEPAAPANPRRRRRRPDPIQGWPGTSAVSGRPHNPSLRGWLFRGFLPGVFFDVVSFLGFAPGGLVLGCPPSGAVCLLGIGLAP